jgi:hypothetical protein
MTLPLLPWPDLTQLAVVLLVLAVPVLVALARQFRRDRRRAHAAVTSAAQKPAATRLSSRDIRTRNHAASYGQIVRYIETAGDRVQNIHSASRSAARHIDNAEVALNRLLADVATIMPNRFAPTVTPRRSLSPLAT